MKNPTRAQYMAGEVGHDEYYRSVARDAGLRYGVCAGEERIKRWRDLLSSGDEHLNRIPLRYWDGLAAAAQSSIARSLREHGDGWSLAGGVCVVKAAARAAVEEAS